MAPEVKGTLRKIWGLFEVQLSSSLELVENLKAAPVDMKA